MSLHVLTSEAPSFMSRRWKTALGVALFGAIIIILIAGIVAPVSYYLDAARAGRAVDTFHLVAIWVAGIAGVIDFVLIVYGLVWVVRNLEGRRRTLWTLGFIFAGGVTAFIWWWKVIRPLPEPSEGI